MKQQPHSCQTCQILASDGPCTPCYDALLTYNRAHARLSVGEKVESGTLGTAQYDCGTIVAIPRRGQVTVAWEIARATYTEDSCDVRPMTYQTFVVAAALS